MRYYFTDFYPWEQPLIDQLRKEGFFVYGVRDREGTRFSIEERVFVNNIGFLVTDKAIPTPLSDTELLTKGKEDANIKDIIQTVSEKISSELADSKAKYQKEEQKIEQFIRELRKKQEIALNV